ncbi:DNA excision repair protein ERCC-1 isoform X2 [Nerophis ophidion]|uniref:DNA excision repair protein ERCC-1 isoform X2 n=1 Tax=Nerophis ophidion TaxID=159077 RepID=UPI002ADFFBB6|nr:DNA excision repair protein ERCC-1 isoform X2 [Nerophis ophidion]
MKKRFNINLDDSAFTRERPPPKHHFQPSSNVVQSSASSSPKKDNHLSYAQYIIKDKDGGALKSTNLRQKEPDSVPSVEDRGETSGGDEVKKILGQEGNQKEGHLGANLGPKPAGSGSSIIVSPRQRGNPILKFVRSVPWEFGEVVPDYVLGQTTCALFLSLRYHNLNPNYIHDRLKQLGHSFTLRVLLVQVDVKDPHHALKELARICIMADCTLILAWSPEEAGRYLETYKSYEKKPADLLKEQVEKDYLSKVTDCLTTVKSINKTDAITLLSTFSSLEGIISASKEDLVLCPGLGPQKARRLHDVLHKPFLKSMTKCDS